MPFVGILTVALGLVTYVKWISNVTIEPDIAKARAEAERLGVPPREAWLMECVQEDRSNPLPCSDEDKAKWPHGQAPEPEPTNPEPTAPTEPGGEDDDLLRQMMGGGGGGGDAPANPGEGGSASPEDDLYKQMMGGGGDGDPAGGGGDAPKQDAPPKAPSEDDLYKEMMGQ
jgi:hypothetical protein